MYVRVCIWMYVFTFTHNKCNNLGVWTSLTTDSMLVFRHCAKYGSTSYGHIRLIAARIHKPDLAWIHMNDTSLDFPEHSWHFWVQHAPACSLNFTNIRSKILRMFCQVLCNVNSVRVQAIHDYLLSFPSLFTNCDKNKSLTREVDEK